MTIVSFCSSVFTLIFLKEKNKAMIKLTGIGDPSGRGEGYNFMREVDPKTNKLLETQMEH